MDLLRQPALLPSTLIQMFSWFVNGVAYYGLTLAASSAEIGCGFLGASDWARGCRKAFPVEARWEGTGRNQARTELSGQF